MTIERQMDDLVAQIRQATKDGDADEAERLRAELDSLDDKRARPKDLITKPPSQRWFVAAAFAAPVLLVTVGVFVFSTLADRPRAIQQPGRSESAVTCQRAIREASRNPSAAKIPAPSHYSQTERGWRVAWRRGDGIRLQNGYGALIDHGAVCDTDRTGRVVLSLEIR